MCFNKVLFIGPEIKSSLSARFNDYSADVGTILGVYQRHIVPFKFIASSKAGKIGVLNLLLFICCYFRLSYRLVIDREIKIVHLHDGGQGSIGRHYLLFVLVRYVFLKKVVYHVHRGNFREYFDTYDSFVRPWITRLINQVDMIICLSVDDLEFFKGRFNQKMVFIVNDAIELYENELNPFIEGDLVKLLFIAKIADIRVGVKSSVKGNIKDNGDGSGLMELLELMENNRSLYMGRVALLIGGVEKCRGKIANKVAGLKKLIREKHLETMVTFVNCTSNHLKARLFDISNVCVLPRGYAASGLSVLEAMNYGATIIAPDNGMIGEVVLNGINGILRPTDDPGGLEHSINYFLLHPDEITGMGAQSRELVKKYDINEVLLNLRLIYLTLLN